MTFSRVCVCVCVCVCAFLYLCFKPTVLSRCVVFRQCNCQDVSSFGMGYCVFCVCVCVCVCVFKAVRKTNGEICKGPEETLNRWQEHFNSLLNNISSDVSQEVLNDVPQLPLREELDLPPSEEEVPEALNSISGNKSGGKNGAQPEMLKCCGGGLS